MANYSTGAKNAQLGTVGLKGAFTNFVLDGMSGARPANADLAPTGTKLVRILLDGTDPLNFLAPVGGVMAKDPLEVWRGMAEAAGTIGYFRLHLASDANGISTTEYRIDLTAGTSGAEINMSALTTTVGPASPHTIDELDFTL